MKKTIVMTLLAAGMAFAAVTADGSQFAKTAAQSGLAEVQMGELASRYGQNPEVKAFGEMLIKDHSKANQQLEQLANKKGMTLPKEPSMIQRANRVALGMRSGQDFDEHFLMMMVSDHQAAVDLFKSQAATGSDPDLKAFAAKIAPVLGDHLAMARVLQERQ